MAITSLRANIGGTWYALTYNETTRRYEAELTLRGTSFHQPGGYFNVTLEATNDSGTVVTADGDDLPGLRLVLKDATPPVLSLVSPQEGFVTSKTPLITLTAMDSESGIDPDTIWVQMDGGDVDFSTAELTGGYQIMATPEELAEGRHTLTATVRDYDGNGATLTAQYVVDTVPPRLLAQEHNLRLIVDVDQVTVTGWTNDVTGPPVTVSITVNGADTGPVTVENDGKFQQAVPLQIGLNEITVTATDMAGLVSTMTFPIIRLITDRTEADVTKVRDLLVRGQAAWTAEEAAWFGRHILRGSYDYTDMNRVSLAMEYLRDHLNKHGYYSKYSRDTFTLGEGITQSRGNGYLADVVSFQALVPPDEEDLVTAPESMDNLTLEGANAIEAILVAVDYSMKLSRIHPWYFGEIYCGEV